MATTSLLRTVAKFLISGVVGVNLGYATLFVLTEFAHIWYIVSAAIAFVLNYASNFMFHKFWTFKKDARGKTHIQLLLYSAFVILLFLMGLGLLYVQVEWFHLWYMLAQIVNTLVLTIVSFLVTRRIFAT